MYSDWIVILLLVGYLLFLWLVALWARNPKRSALLEHPIVYSLSIGVFCSAWTFYGSIGAASQGDLSFLTVYLGPVIIAPIWFLVLRKTIQIARANHVASLADFLSIRYGNSRVIGLVVSLICVFSILPYISLQVKAITDTTSFISSSSGGGAGYLPPIVVGALAFFAAQFGVRYTDASDRHDSIVATVAIESVVKLICFVIVGVTVAMVYYGEEMVGLSSPIPELGGAEGGFNWMFLLVIAMFAFVLLPRQFQMAVVDNKSDRQLKMATWLVPLYLLVFNLFVFPIAASGSTLLSGFNPDLYLLSVPDRLGMPILSLIGYVGGFSAAISMIVVSSIALSTMLTNNVLIPYGLLRTLEFEDALSNQRRIKTYRRISILTTIGFSYLLYHFFFAEASLLSIGLIAFVLISQFIPMYLGAIYWKGATRTGALWGVMVGFGLCVYTLLFPFALSEGSLELIFGRDWSWLHPYRLFGQELLDPIPQAVFWSLSANAFVFVGVSAAGNANHREHNAAEMYVDIDRYADKVDQAYVWKGTAYMSDLVNLLSRFAGEKLTQRILEKYNYDLEEIESGQQADALFIRLVERLLTGRVGPSSARILLSKVVKEEDISLQEVLEILDESHQKTQENQALQEQSEALRRMSNELNKANAALRKKDKEKDEFMDVVSHELKTPITSIRATAELLKDGNIEMTAEESGRFLQNILDETDRILRLVLNLLDLEKIATEKYRLRLRKSDLRSTIRKAAANLENMLRKKNMNLDLQLTPQASIAFYDEDKIIQVIANLVENAFKYSNQGSQIKLRILRGEKDIRVEIEDFGKGISPEESQRIFDKYYQARQKTTAEGVGLGLAISRRIIELHQGHIGAQSKSDGSIFFFSLPRYTSTTPPTH